MARMKKEDAFYTMLKQLVATIEDAAVEYERVIAGYPETISSTPQIKVYETECDEQVKKIMEELYKAFITPFDREDISELALALDDIVDGMNGVVRRFDLFNVHEIREESAQMAELTVRCVREVRAAIELLPDYKKDERVMQHAIMVSAIEDEGDTVYENALRRLFLDEENGRTTTAWLRLCDRMESVFDACDHVACIVRSVVMKSA